VIFHDIENSTNKTTTDTLHWSAFNIPGTTKGLPEGLGAGDLPDGTRNGPGIAARGGNPGAYFGPGAGPGPFHHYVFEFYALDTKLDLQPIRRARTCSRLWMATSSAKPRMLAAFTLRRSSHRTARYSPRSRPGTDGRGGLKPNRSGKSSPPSGCHSQPTRDGCRHHN